MNYKNILACIFACVGLSAYADVSGTVTLCVKNNTQSFRNIAVGVSVPTDSNLTPDIDINQYIYIDNIFVDAKGSECTTTSPRYYDNYSGSAVDNSRPPVRILNNPLVSNIQAWFSNMEYTAFGTNVAFYIDPIDDIVKLVSKDPDIAVCNIFKGKKPIYCRNSKIARNGDIAIWWAIND
jgi:hypothetical protein